MAERKHKREAENPELETEESCFILEPTQVELGSGYTLSVSYDENEDPIVNIKTYGLVNIAKLRREIEKIFPNARIKQLNQTHSIAIVKKRKKKNRK
jgi:hypothetical protein